MFQIIIPKRLVKVIDKLQTRLREKVLKALAALQTDPRPNGVVKMVGYANLWRIRIGDYRVIYEIHDQVLEIHLIEVDHRREAYR